MKSFRIIILFLITNISYLSYSQCSNLSVNAGTNSNRITENLYEGQINDIKQLEGGLLGWDSPEAKRLEEHAYQEYLRRQSLGQDAFYD